ncbi:hypothetical protein CGMCC3_g16514 [Colletotrichum fructicola]|nr:uncharacterized protein CGMCC3_g16514 [Colletotrichum fructicola]KAE9567345.1 hypothetical protein CGMCC3_g16514 [Colletotrichum fructicola]
MSKIYREAERVLFWLGPGTEDMMNAMLYLQWLRVKVDQVEAHDHFRDILEMGDENQLELRRWIASKLTDAYDFSPYESNLYDSDPYDSDPYDSDPYDSDPYDSEPYDSEPYDSEPYDSEPYDGDSYDSDSYDRDPYSLEARLKWEWPWDHEQGFQELLLVPWF